MEWTMTGKFIDGYEAKVHGKSSKDCIYKLMDCFEDEHGELIYYLGFNSKTQEYVEGEAM